MEDLFRSYWWLLFPLAWFVFGGFNRFLNYRRQKDALKLIQTYAEKGQEPPAALLKVLDRPLDEEGAAMWGGGNSGGYGRSGDGAWFSTVLFGVMAPPARDHAFQAAVARRIAGRRAWMSPSSRGPSPPRRCCGA